MWMTLGNGSAVNIAQLIQMGVKAAGDNYEVYGVPVVGPRFTLAEYDNETSAKAEFARFVHRANWLESEWKP